MEKKHDADPPRDDAYLMRCAIDTGGTFTDLAVERDGAVRIFKASTTPDDPIEGILAVLAKAASELGTDIGAMLAETTMVIHGTTRATNAVLTGNTARTAIITTLGHPDVLLLREGGRTRSFDWSEEYPGPYIPRALTFEAHERVDAQGRVRRPLDETKLIADLDRLAELEVEAVAVCLLWSIVNPAHEERVGALLDKYVPGVPYTLSHALNPTLREYRRASSAAIDASLKPLMTDYLRNLEVALRAVGFEGDLLVVSTSGGLMHAREAAAAPITSINSGPAMAPVAGRSYAAVHGAAADAIVADTGGTSYDISVVRGGRIPMSRETWLGEPLTGHITGFPAVDVKSIGAGGGSIAWIDDGGLLHVGPQSAGADPGPVAYGRGGDRPTVTDACLVLGYLDPARFLDGEMRLDAPLARESIAFQIAGPLRLEVEAAAAAIMELATEQMVQAIAEITVDAGIDPRGAVLVGGGGAAGLNSAAILRRLGCEALVIPEAGAALSAVGALMADLSADFARACFTSSAEFDAVSVDAVMVDLRGRCAAFAREIGAEHHEVEVIAEARLSRQVWQIDVPMRADVFVGRPESVEILVDDFRRLHEEIFAVRDLDSPVEIVALRARVTCALEGGSSGRFAGSLGTGDDDTREVYFSGHGKVNAPVRALGSLGETEPLPGPAIVESPLSTIVVEPGSIALRSPGSGLVIKIQGRSEDRQEVGGDVGTIFG